MAGWRRVEGGGEWRGKEGVEGGGGDFTVAFVYSNNNATGD